MKVGIYAGSIRPGGGLTVLRQVVEGLVANTDNQVIIYTGAADTSEDLQDLVSKFTNIEERRFYPGYSSLQRYLISKFFFLSKRESSTFDWLISFNYHIPASCRVMVYHINLLSFMAPATDSIAMKIKRWDARLACRLATANIFESKYLWGRAKRCVSKAIRNPSLLYVGVNREFFSSAKTEGENYQRDNLLMVSSNQGHKDNESCLKVLQLLSKKRPEVQWKLIVVGGQSTAQWEHFGTHAELQGVKKNVEIRGRVERKRLSQMMANSLCLLNASKVESFCMVAVESMAARCPVIVTRATSMPESVGGAAVIVEPGNVEQFAQAVICFYDDSKLRRQYIEKGLNWAAHFTPDQFGKNLMRLLETDKARSACG